MAFPRSRDGRGRRVLAAACAAALCVAAAVVSATRTAAASVTGIAALAVSTAASPARILLARHGESVFNRDGIFHGSLRGVMKGPKLTRLGHRQAKELGRSLLRHCGSMSNASVFVSPLKRARQTWDGLRDEVDIPKERAMAWMELREIDLFEWEGRPKAEIQAEYPEQWRMWLQEPWHMEMASGMRPVPLLLARAAGVWARLCMEARRAGAGSTTLVVAHGGLNRAVLLKALGLPDEGYGDPVYRFPNCGVAEVEVAPSERGIPGASRWRWLIGNGSEPSPWLEASSERARLRRPESSTEPS